MQTFNQELHANQANPGLPQEAFSVVVLQLNGSAAASLTIDANQSDAKLASAFF